MKKQLIISILVLLPSLISAQDTYMSVPDANNNNATWEFIVNADGGSATLTNIVTTSDFNGTLVIPAYVTDDAGNPQKYMVTVLGENIPHPNIIGVFGSNTAIKGVNFNNASNSTTISDCVFNTGSTDTNTDGSTSHQLTQKDLDLSACTKLTYIGVEAFHCQMGLTGTLTIPASVVTINGGSTWGAFRYTDFSTINIIDTESTQSALTTLGVDAFSAMADLTGDVVIPAGVTIIDDGIFRQDPKLRSVTFKGTSVISFVSSRAQLATGLFNGSTRLEYVDMSHSAGILSPAPTLDRSVGPTIANVAYPFYKLPAHTIVYLPKDVTYNTMPTYNFQVTTDKMPLAYSANPISTNYTVTSTYGTTPVAWTLDGYDANGDGVYSMSEKPEWITDLTVVGNGGVSDAGTANLTDNPTIDMVKWRDDTMKGAEALVTADEPYDLSTHDINGAPTLMNTANSYVISAQGFYKIPLVYGNGIKAGLPNTAAYTSTNTTERSEYILNPFYDDTDAGIVSPYINVQRFASPAVAASIVWSDDGEIVNDATLAVTGTGQNSYLQFQVPGTLKNGNAVVAVQDANGNILWSWHLWFTTNEVLDLTTVYNYSGKPYDFIDENLGFVPTLYNGSPKRKINVRIKQAMSNNVCTFTIRENGNKVDLEGFANLYQFGRKDPFQGTKDATALKKSSSTQTIGNSVRNPGLFFLEVGGGDWVGPYAKYNLWSANDGRDPNFLGNPVVKTIYDPSPVGCSVPASDVFTGFGTTLPSPGDHETTPNATSTSISTVKGFDFYTAPKSDPNFNQNSIIYFPACGNLDYATGKLYATNINLYYRMATTESDGDACNMQYITQRFTGDIGVGFYTRTSNNSARGQSVRPVANPN